MSVLYDCLLFPYHVTGIFSRRPPINCNLKASVLTLKHISSQTTNPSMLTGIRSSSYIFLRSNISSDLHQTVKVTSVGVVLFWVYKYGFVFDPASSYMTISYWMGHSKLLFWLAVLCVNQCQTFPTHWLTTPPHACKSQRYIRACRSVESLSPGGRKRVYS